MGASSGEREGRRRAGSSLPERMRSIVLVVCLICASKGNIHMTDVAIDRCAEGGTSQCGPQVARARAERGGGCLVVVAPVRNVAPSGLPIHRKAHLIGRPVPVVETATAVTFKLPPSLVDAVRARAAAEGTTISDMVSRALRAFLGEADGNG